MDTTPPTDDLGSDDSWDDGSSDEVSYAVGPENTPLSDGDDASSAVPEAAGDAVVPADHVSADDVPADDVPVDDVPVGEAGVSQPQSDAWVEAGGAAAGTSAESWNSEAVFAAVQALESVDARPLGEHPDAFGSVHGELQRALADIDDA